MTRRGFLRLVAASASAVVARPARAVNDPSSRALWLRRGGDAVLLDLDTPEGYKGAAWMLRDVHAGVIGRPSPDLLRLLAWAQAWLAAYGYHECYAVHSGLRTPFTNQMTEGAALNSRHLPNANMVFRASDVSMARIDASYLARVFALAKYGGVGLYDRRGFVHVDDDRVRYWRK